MRKERTVTGLFFLFRLNEVLQKEVARGHKGNVAELPIVLGVVGDYHVATTSHSTLVLQQIFKITYICMRKCSIYFLSTSKPNIHLVRSSAASSGVNLSQPTSSSISGSIFTSAIFLARYSSSAFRFASSASWMASFIYSTTSCIKSSSASFVQSRMGANAEAWILLAAAVITHQCFGSRCKDRYLF